MGKRKHKDKDSSELWKKIRRLERLVERQTDDQDSYYSDSRYDSEQSYYSPSARSNHEYYSDQESETERNPNTLRSVVTPVPNPDERAVAIPDPNLKPSEGNPESANSVPELPSEILEALGVSKEKDEVFGPKIREEVSKRWGKIIMEGLSKENRQKLMENTLIPENFQLLKAPKLNPEISAVLSESTKNRDKRLEKSQGHLGIGIAAITNLMSTLIEGELDKAEIIKKLSETGQVLLDLHNQNTVTRRKLITYSLDKKFLNMVQGVKRDSFLFGENLGEKIKATKTAERSGLHIKRSLEPQPSTSYRTNRLPTRQGNSRIPPRQQNQRGRPGGFRAQTSTQTTTRSAGTTDRYTSSRPNHNNNKPVRKSR